MKKKKIIYLVLMAFLVGCAGLFGVKDNSKPLTPKAQATLFMNTYKAEIADLQSLSKLTNATLEQKQVFKVKQAILVKIKPLLDLYIGVIKGNGMPDASLQNSINDLVNQLVMAGGGL